MKFRFFILLFSCFFLSAIAHAAVTVPIRTLDQAGATNGQAIIWNGTFWAPGTVASGASSWASITGKPTTAAGFNITNGANIDAWGAKTIYAGTFALTTGKTFSVTDNIIFSTDGTGTRTLNIGAGGTLGSAAYTAASAYEVPLTFTAPLTRTTNAISLANTAVTPATYTLATITVDAQGRITAASNGSAGVGDVTAAGTNDFTGPNSFSQIPRLLPTTLATGTGQTAAIGTHYRTTAFTSNITISALSGTLNASAKITFDLFGCNGTAVFDFTGFGTAKRKGATDVASTSLTPTAGNHTISFEYDLTNTTWYYSDSVPSPVNLAGGAGSVAGQLPAANVVTSTFITTGSAEINALTSKATPTTSDLLMIEDAAAANAKKKVTVDAVLAANDARTKTLSNTRMTSRVHTAADAATVTPDFDSYDQENLLTLSQTTTIANPTYATLNGGDKRIIRIKSTTIRAISFGNAYRGSIDGALPTATSGSSLTDYLGFIYNAADSKWDLVSKNFGF